MTRPDCTVDELELIALLDGELTENRARQLREHRTICPACAGRMDRLHALAAQLRAPVPEAFDPGFVDAVERRLPAADAHPPRRALRRGPVALGLGTLAAAAALALIAIPRSPSPSEFAARGSAAPWHALVTTTLDVVAGRPRTPLTRPLATGERLHPGDGIAVSAHNGNARTPVHLMVFAVDAKNEVHWIVPAWSNASENPRSALLPPGGALPGPAGRTPEAPAPGKLRVLTLLSRTALDVRTIEDRLRGGRPLVTGEDRHLQAVEVEMARAAPP